jgi:hypothetical protein
MMKARAKLTAQLWDVVEHLKPSGTLEEGAVVDVVRRHPKRNYLVVLHQGEVHAVFGPHLERV